MSIGEAEKLEALSDQNKRGCRAWSKEEESLLIALRSQNQKCTWAQLTDTFNAQFPPERHRSCDAVISKWRVLKKRTQHAIEQQPYGNVAGATGTGVSTAQVRIALTYMSKSADHIIELQYSNP